MDVGQVTSAHVAGDVYRFRALLVHGRALGSSSPTHMFAELLLKTYLRRFDCGILFCRYYDVYLYNTL